MELQQEMFKPQKIILMFLLLFSATMSSPYAHCDKLSGFAEHEKFDRNQTMLINLQTAPESAGYYILHSYGNTKQMSHDLDRALNQISAVDQSYAKSRNRPDDRYLQAVSLKITAAKQTAAQLEDQLSDAFAQLKSSIKETLVTDSNFN
jgi:hypothetical protein